MFTIGDLVIYSAHGICRIDDICEKTYSGITRTYYVIHPVEDPNLTINAPVDSDSIVIHEMIQKDDAVKILESFKEQGLDWNDKNNQRNQEFSTIIRNGNRKEISKLANTLMRRKIEVEMMDKKFSEHDRKLLDFIQNILFKELAISLNTTFEDILDRVTRTIHLTESHI